MEARELRLKIILAALDMSVQDLADDIGAERSLVSRVLTGQRTGRKVRQQLAAAIQERIDQLLPPLPATKARAEITRDVMPAI